MATRYRVVGAERVQSCPAWGGPHVHETHEDEYGLRYYFCDAKGGYLAECSTCECYCDCALGIIPCGCGCHEGGER